MDKRRTLLAFLKISLFQRIMAEENITEPVEYTQEDYPCIKFYIKGGRIEWTKSFCMEADSEYVDRIEENGRIKYVATKPLSKNSPIHVGLPFWQFIMEDRYPKKSHVLLSDCLKILAKNEIWKILLDEVSLKELEPRIPKAEMLIKLKEDTESGIPIDIGGDMVHIYYKILNNMIQRENRLFIYYRSSALAHSCEPNAGEIVNDKGMRSVYAIKDIQPGEEITVSYLTHNWNVTVTKQREGMLEINNELCKCSLCTKTVKRMRKKRPGKKY